MDRILGLQNVESMRKTILFQEQMFKHQVQELHRIYNLQKKLIDEHEKELIQKRDPYILRNHQDMSSCCSGDQTSRMPIQFDLERQSESALSSIHHGDLKGIDEETDIEVELTLSIGHCMREQRLKRHMHDSDQAGERSSSSMGTTSKGEECGDPGSNISSSSGYRDSKQPHWLLQDLSLNRT